jgi:hypothetical protein
MNQASDHCAAASRPEAGFCRPGGPLRVVRCSDQKGGTRGNHGFPHARRPSFQAGALPG